MKLIIGGYSQNKEKYVRELYPDAIFFETSDIKLIDSVLWQENKKGIIVINKIHLMIKDKLKAGMQIETIWQNFQNLINNLSASEVELIFISDEIGGGIVPLDAFEREWREVTGRILCRLAEKADKVTRIVMGLAQIIKG